VVFAGEEAIAGAVVSRTDQAHRFCFLPLPCLHSMDFILLHYLQQMDPADQISVADYRQLRMSHSDFRAHSRMDLSHLAEACFTLLQIMVLGDY